MSNYVSILGSPPSNSNCYKTITIGGHGSLAKTAAMKKYKAVLDCLQRTKTIKNDNKCVKILVEKFIDKTNPRIEFDIIEV